MTQLRSFSSTVLRALCCTTQRQLSDFQIHFKEQSFWQFRQGYSFSRTYEIAIFAAKTGSRVLSLEAQKGSLLAGKSKSMRARPQVRDILIAHKLRYWSLRARYSYPNCSQSRARRNFLRLLARHPEIARRMNLDLRDAYPPL